MPERPAFATEDWILEQQMRAELEAEAWRRLRREAAAPAALAAPVAAPVAAPSAAPDYHSTGSTILKAFVRFGLASFASYVGWIAAMDSALGEFEVWLAVGSAFIVTLALSLFPPIRGFVHFLAETARWVIIAGVAFGALWLVLQNQG